MCGIAGIFDPLRPPGRPEVVPMVSMQRHRGPDADGFLIEDAVAMGMRRLSIIDVAGGNQPIFNEDGSVAVVFNGEIYNYRELRASLLRRGHRFATSSDTEVLVHLYEDHGPDFLSELNGMFAFALWDRRGRALLLARDRMGVKPLYWAQSGPRIYFASELKSLWRVSDLDFALDPDALADYLRLGYIPRDASPYKTVNRLLPGHRLYLRPGGRNQPEPWWDLANFREDSGCGDPQCLRRALERTFDDAVHLRMRSDVPVAAFLSGGLDSSLVTATATRGTEMPIQSFSLGFEHAEFDELPYARAVAEQSSTRHRELIATTSDALNNLPRLIWHMDEPMGDSSIVPNFLISRFAAQHVKVCLSGLGGDELFGGYARYHDPGPGRIRRAFGPIPELARLAAGIVRPVSRPWADELLLASGESEAWRGYMNRLQVFSPQGLRAIGFPATGRADSTIETLWNRYPGRDPVSRRQFIDQHTYLPDEILALTDRMSMANSLEVRVPFMDFRLVRFAQLLKTPMKQTANEFKIFLKQALGDRVPARIVNRPKWGFDTPLGRWVSRPEVYRLLPRLLEGACVRNGLLRPRGVARLFETPDQARRFARRVWNVLVLEIWMRVQRRLSPPSESLEEILMGHAA